MAEKYNKEYCDIIKSNHRSEEIKRIDSLWEKIKIEAIKEYSHYLDCFISYEDKYEDGNDGNYSWTDINLSYEIRKHRDYVEEIKNKRIELLKKRDELMDQIIPNFKDKFFF